MTGESTAAEIAVVCPSCGEIYDTRERAYEVLRNSGFCVNITCLEDLSAFSFGPLLTRSGEGKRQTDRWLR